MDLSTILEDLLRSLLPKIIEFLQSDRFAELVDKVVAGLRSLLDGLNAEG